MSLTQVSNAMLKTPGGGGVGGTTVPYAGTALTLNSGNTSTYNGNVIAATNGSAQVFTLAAGAALTGGLVIEQLGAGLCSIAASGVTLNAPNGLSTSGARTTLVVVQEATDVYTVYAQPTADRTIDLGTVGATTTLDLAKYNVFKLTLSANLTISVTGAVAGQHFAATLYIAQDASHTVVFSPAAKTPAAAGYTMTTSAGKVDAVTISTLDGGTTLYLFIGGQDMR